MNGVINLFKPRGMTSHDAVSHLRKILKIKKIGHIGTLDPNATGVLPLCIGKATRIVEYLVDLDKEYVGELTLGIRTDTQDMDGKVISTSEKKVDENQIHSIMEKYQGNLSQLPPMYSALKHKGKKLYELAREGKNVERQPRNIKIYDQKIIDIQDCNSIIFYVKCSRGTYIRTLCDDIGMELGTFGYMSYLIRTGVGDFKINDSYSIEYIKKLGKEKFENILIPMDVALGHLDEIVVEEKNYDKLINGNIIKLNSQNGERANKSLRVYCNNKFIGIGKIIMKDSNFYVKMDKVLVI